MEAVLLLLLLLILLLLLLLLLLLYDLFSELKEAEILGPKVILKLLLSPDLLPKLILSESLEAVLWLLLSLLLLLLLLLLHDLFSESMEAEVLGTKVILKLLLSSDLLPKLNIFCLKALL